MDHAGCYCGFVTAEFRRGNESRVPCSGQRGCINKVLIPRNSIKRGKLVVFDHGFWWFIDPDSGQELRLDPIIERCKWRIGPLCEALGVEKRTFARLIVKNLGITGKKWLRQLRVVAACHLLREGGKVTLVARRLGFRDDSHFTSDFKMLMGVCPSVFMKAEQSRSRI